MIGDLKRLIEQVCRDKGIDKDLLLNTIMDAVRSAARKKSSFTSVNAGVFQGAMAPSFRESLLFGMTLSRSMSTTRPKPVHSGQAPNTLLKLNRCGVGRVYSRSQDRQPNR